MLGGGEGDTRRGRDLICTCTAFVPINSYSRIAKSIKSIIKIMLPLLPSIACAVNVDCNRMHVFLSRFMQNAKDIALTRSCCSTLVVVNVVVCVLLRRFV